VVEKIWEETSPNLNLEPKWATRFKVREELPPDSTEERANMNVKTLFLCCHPPSGEVKKLSG